MNESAPESEFAYVCWPYSRPGRGLTGSQGQHSYLVRLTELGITPLSECTVLSSNYSAMNDHLNASTGKLTHDLFASQPNCRQRILVVEEEGNIRQLNAEVLIDAGYQVDVRDQRKMTSPIALRIFGVGLITRRISRRYYRNISRR